MLVTCACTTRSLIASALAIPWSDEPVASNASTFLLARRQPGQGIVAAPTLHQGGDNLGVDGGPATAHPADRVDEPPDVADPILQEVPDALG